MSQRGPEYAREWQREPEWESQRAIESPREKGRDPVRARKSQRKPERVSKSQREPEWESELSTWKAGYKKRLATHF